MTHIKMESSSEDSDALYRNIRTDGNGITIELYLEEDDSYPFTDIHIELYEGNLRVIIWEPNDLQSDPTRIIAIPLDTPLLWDRKTGEDIPQE